MAPARRGVLQGLEYAHPNLYRKSTGNSVVQDVGFAGMVGTLAQLGMIAHYATELFQELEKDLTTSFERIEKAQVRIQGLVDNRVKHEKKEIATTLRVVFDTSNMSLAFKEMYNSKYVERLPAFEVIDQIVDQDCCKKYSNPGFFLDEWAAAEMATINKRKQEKAKEKLQKKEKRKEKSKHKKKQVNVVTLGDWRSRYNLDDVDQNIAQRNLNTTAPTPSRIATDHDTTVEEAVNTTKKLVPVNPTMNRSSSLKSTHSQDEERPSFTPKESVSPRLSPARFMSPPKKQLTPHKKVLPPPPMPNIQPYTDEEVSSPKKIPPMPVMAPIPSAWQQEEDEEDEALSTPVTSRETLHQQQNEDQDIMTTPAAEDQSKYAKYFSMLRMGIPKAAVAHKMQAEGLDPSVLDDDSDDDEDLYQQQAILEIDDDHRDDDHDEIHEEQAQDLEALPKARPPDHLAAIKQGANLKPVTAIMTRRSSDDDNNNTAAASGGGEMSGLLAAIRGGGKNLRKLDDSSLKPKDTPAPASVGGLLGNEVDKILALRSKIEMSDSDDESDDDWDDDDDDDF